MSKISRETVESVASAIWDHIDDPDGDDNTTAQSAITAFIASKEMQELLEKANKVAVYLDRLFPDNPWAGIASDELSKALLPFTSEQQS